MQSSLITRVADSVGNCIGHKQRFAYIEQQRKRVSIPHGKLFNDRLCFGICYCDSHGDVVALCVCVAVSLAVRNALRQRHVQPIPVFDALCPECHQQQ